MLMAVGTKECKRHGGFARRDCSIFFLFPAYIVFFPSLVLLDDIDSSSDLPFSFCLNEGPVYCSSKCALPANQEGELLS
jgi:hypothetical protein